MSWSHRLTRQLAPLSAIVLLLSIAATPQAHATESCEYSLHSVRAQADIQVCELPNKGQACQSFLKPAGAKDRNAFGSSAVKRTKTRCRDLSKVVGVCVLPTTRLAFLDGDPGVLEIGCANMLGEWRVISVVQKRDPGFLEKLQ